MSSLTAVELVSTVIDELVSQLDSKYEAWDLYRAHDKTWRLSIGEGRAKITFESETITAAMQKALHYISLPLVPRCPIIPNMTYFSVRKSGSYWTLEYQGRDIQYRIDTKKKAMATASLIQENAKVAHKKWEEEHGWTLNKEQGVDFEYLNP
jgi:hypothetical protein